jgi:hypothetical protein
MELGFLPSEKVGNRAKSLVLGCPAVLDFPFRNLIAPGLFKRLGNEFGYGPHSICSITVASSSMRGSRESALTVAALQTYAFARDLEMIRSNQEGEPYVRF